MIYEWYKQKKQEMPVCILLLRIGDFYEAFDEDAEVLAKVCGMVVFPRALSTGTVPMAGFPVAVMLQNVIRLRRAGYDVRTIDLADKWIWEDADGIIGEDQTNGYG